MNWPESITTDRLTLRPPVETDARAIFDGYAQDPDVVRYLMWRPHTHIGETHEYLAHCRAGWDTRSDLTWALTSVSVWEQLSIDRSWSARRIERQLADAVIAAVVR